MARKYDLISELYDRTCKTVVSSPQNWEAFLTSACRNYKLRFDEQLLASALSITSIFPTPIRASIPVPFLFGK